MGGKQLGDYLRARREIVRPEDVGLPPGGRRRVPGLRREELALLAGISTDYYLRLEQGRDQNPSPQVLDALARVLQLDEPATAHLHALASPPRRNHNLAEPDHVSPEIRQLISTWWSQTPVIVLNRYMDVLASNALATAMSPIFLPGVNVIRAAFLDKELRSLYLNWDEMSVRAVAGLRALVGTELEDVRVVELVGELTTVSPEFQRLWVRHDVSPRAAGVAQLNHPGVGEMTLQYERFTIAGTHGQLIVVFHAEPGSPSAEKLAQLQAETTSSRLHR
ncbi:helix-turn-helix transcriptional regulator [Streptomyces sp. NPDC058691]|uniref:helix-turn-helix transcriptional regulator n=1 Tax=Streptomyces sp. NPDC058691 TaxID=3346601 RepID=UPI0036629CD5